MCFWLRRCVTEKLRQMALKSDMFSVYYVYCSHDSYIKRTIEGEVELKTSKNILSIFSI